MPRKILKSTGRRKAPHKKKRRRASRRHISTAPGQITVSNGRVVMVLPRRLRSPNQIKTHWAYRADRDAWRKELARAVVDDSLGKRIGTPRMILDHIRMRLDVLRLAPSRRYLLDKDNMDYCAKRLQDALKEFGYIVDDNASWLDGPYVTQDISSDKKYWAIVTLTPIYQAKVIVRREALHVDGVDPKVVAHNLLMAEVLKADNAGNMSRHG